MAADTDYFSELEAVGSNSSTVSPMPGGSAFQTPRASMSRRSSSRRQGSRGGSSSPPPSSPPPLPTSSPGTNHDDTTIDEDISPLDPRRFTPTLHASLVSEILNLRRELDSKHKFIEDLETSLHAAKTEKDEIADKLSQADKDRRSLKRQFQQLENGTLSALEELAKDRDQAKKSCTDFKTKLDEAQEKIKRKEEESDRTHAAWEKEQNAWETERRGYERRVHVTETRLKKVVAELEAVHRAQTQIHVQQSAVEEDEATRDSGLGDESDTASQASPRRNASHNRTMSNSSRRSFGRYRFSVQSLAGADGQKPGISLADELQLEEEDEEDLISEPESEHPQQQQQQQDSIAKKGIVAKTSQFFEDRSKRISSAELRKVLQAPIELDRPAGVDQSTITEAFEPVKVSVQYVDTGVQYTPPPSPRLEAKDVQAKQVQTDSDYCDTGIQYEPVEFEEISTPPLPNDHRKDSKVDLHFANELRKDVATPPLVDRGQQMSPTASPKRSLVSMVSAGSQTMDEPLSPPATPGVSPPASPTEVVHVHLQPSTLR